jgi:hypothetical protein
MTNDARAKISELIVESQEFLEPARLVQENELNEGQRQAALRDLEKRYREWYRACLTLFVQYEQYGLREEFISEFEGEWHKHRIDSFFKHGWKTHRIAKWVAPFRRCFEIPLEKQCDILASLAGIVNKNE